MKNILLGLFILLSCQAIAQHLSEQYPIQSKSTKFTKESPRYKGVPYDSAYLEAKAGERVWVFFELRKAPLTVEIVRPSGQKDTLFNDISGLFGLRSLDRIYTATESGKHLFRFTYQDDDFKKLYRLSLGIIPPAEVSPWSFQDLTGQRLQKLAPYAPWEFKSVVTGTVAKGFLNVPDKDLSYYGAVSTQVFPHTKDYTVGEEYQSLILDNQTLNAVSGAYALLRSELLTYLRTKASDGTVVQDVPQPLLAMGEVRSCNFQIPVSTESTGKTKEVLGVKFTTSRTLFTGLQLSIVEDYSKRSSDFRYSLKLSMKRTDYRRRPMDVITTTAPTGTGEMQFPPLTNSITWPKIPESFEEHLRKLCGMVKTNFEGISSATTSPQPELQLIVGERVMLNTGKNYTITLTDELLGSSHEMALIQMINHVIGALYQPNKTKLEYGTELNPQQGVVQSFKLINPDHVVRILMKQTKTVTGVVSSEVMEIIVAKE